MTTTIQANALPDFSTDDATQWTHPDGDVQIVVRASLKVEVSINEFSEEEDDFTDIPVKPEKVYEELNEWIIIFPSCFVQRKHQRYEKVNPENVQRLWKLHAWDMLKLMGVVR